MLELLSPAGSTEVLRAAVQNGADAVYLGGGSFNARMEARNFSGAELQDAVKYCHIRGVKVHMTLNTLVSDRELTEVAALVREAAEAGVDALIVQDLGVVSLCRRVAPNLALHASTQMSLHSLEGVRQAAAMGLTRAVLARELSREAIAYICRHSPIEIEVFGHGALCMCYSGQCYLSAMIGQRSGNRGLCAQPCRLPYGFGRPDRKFPLSLKDNCLVGAVDELSRLGVASLKLEGRMKRPEYVAIVTRIYRSAIDGHPPGPRELGELERAFSREGFTRGYYDGQIGGAMFGIHRDTPPDRELYAAARATYENGEAQRVPVRFYALVSRGQPAMLAVEDGDGHICKTVGPMPEEAVSHALTGDELAARLSKTGGTPYRAENARCAVDRDLSLPAASVNAMRRDVLNQLNAVRGRVEPPMLGDDAPVAPASNPRTEPALTVSALRLEQVTTRLLREKPETLYLPVSELCRDRAQTARLAERVNVAAVLPRIVWDDAQRELLRQLDTLWELGVKEVLLNNLGQIEPARSRGFALRGDFGLNLFNSRAMQWMQHWDFRSVTASFESTLPQIRDMHKPVPTELIAYGRLPLMITENCIIQRRAEACTCGGSVKLTDRRGEEFPVVRDCGTCRSVLLNGKKLWLLDKRAELRELGLWALRLSFTTENPAQVDSVLTAWQTGEAFEPGSCTRGLYARGVK